jgi:sugar phosphate permease
MEYAAVHAQNEPEKIYKKVSLRIIPFLFLCYVVAYLDRTNLGFAKLQMQSALHFNSTVYGLGAGIFFLGYALCEVPSNLILKRIGTTKTLTRILILWGLVSTAMIFVSNSTTFYISRFLLGMFEAGLVPGTIYFLTLWFPNRLRGRMLALFFLGMPISGVVGGPIAGWAMQELQGVLNLAGWQWLFVIEGVPAIALGVFCSVILTESPRHAKWLSERERQLISRETSDEFNHASAGKNATFLKSLKDINLYLLAAAYFTFICGIYVIGFWLPTVLRNAGIHDALSVGLYSMIPFGISAIGMVIILRSSDSRLERKWHLAVCATVGAASLIMIPMAHNNLILSLIVLTVATTAIYTTLPLFWAVPSSYYAGTEGSAGSLALINSLGLIGGFVSPTIMGWLNSATGSLTSGLYAMAGLLVAGTLVLLLGVSARAFEKRSVV